LTGNTDAKLELLDHIFKQINTEEHLKYLNINIQAVTSEEIHFDRSGRLFAWLSLEKAVASIPDLRNHQIGLAFVGMLGHFTSGKSTLINALLNNPSLRTPDQHPTDTAITLICHPDAYEELQGNTFTSIDGININAGPEMPFLNNIVLVDTPGLGNTEAEHELTERFLHLCHVIVITIDGRVPFADTKANFQLLDKAINKLISVPKIFVITKSDVFLSHRTGNYTTHWEKQRADEFLVGVKSRMVSDPRFSDKRQLIDDIPVVFVDSIDKYNINNVINLITPITKDDTQRPRIYEAQGNYVVQIARDSISVFQTYLSDRLTNLNVLYAEANSKAEKAKDILNRRTDSVNAAIQTATNKVNHIHESFQKLEAQWEFALPDVGLMKDSFQNFEKIMIGMETHVRKHDSIIVTQAVSSVRSQARKMLRAFFSRQSKFNEKAVISSCNQPCELPDHNTTSSWLLRLNEYSDRACEKISADIPSRWGLNFLGTSSENIRVAFREAFQSITGGLGSFIEGYNIAANAFVAYLTQPDSKKLLEECGVILFDEDDDVRALKAAEMSNDDFSSRAAVDTLVQRVRDDIVQFEQREENFFSSLDRFAISKSLRAPQAERSDLLALINDTALENLVKHEITQFTSTLQSAVIAAVKKINESQALLKRQLMKILMDWLGIFTKVVLFGAYIFLFIKVLEISNSNLYDKFWSWFTDITGPFVMSLSGALVIEVIKFIFGKNQGIDSRDKYTLGLRPLFKFIEEKGTIVAGFESQLESAEKDLRGRIDQLPIDMRDRSTKFFKSKFKETGQNNEVVKIGEMVQTFQEERKNIFNKAKGEFEQHIAALRSELTSISEKKRIESVDRVIERITDTQQSVKRFSTELASFDVELST